MSTNPQILEKFLEQKREEIDPGFDPSEFFNYFITQEILKDFELSYDEIQNGIVDGVGDGGIDAIYTLVNGELTQRDTGSCHSLGQHKRYIRSGVDAQTPVIQY